MNAGAHSQTSTTWTFLEDAQRGGRSSYLCGGALGIPSASTVLDHGLSSLLPAAIVVLALGAAFVWMVRRWGIRPSTSPASRPAAAPAREPQPEYVSVLSEPIPAATSEPQRELVLQD